ncbi:MAG: leucine-rich repeat protein, partial [Lachnospiraceae bacterium]|nr:leucine-rich repeat protein [Lachnospiraceae bacterium]
MEFPAGLTSIGNDAFYNCRELTSITIPESVTEVGFRVFYLCKKLTITCPAGSYIEEY